MEIDLLQVGVICLIAAVALTILGGIWKCVLTLIDYYNEFVRLKNNVEEGFSAMDIVLKRRYDLIPNLVETAKGYTSHESGTLEK